MACQQLQRWPWCAQAFGALLLPTAMMYMLERRVRLAFLHSVFAPSKKSACANQESFEGSSSGLYSGACSSAEALSTPYAGSDQKACSPRFQWPSSESRGSDEEG